jgi:probable FeS assembly SUF system protein SufT
VTTTRPTIELTDDCAATLIPSGMTAILHAGDTLVVSLALGSSNTVETPTGHRARIEARDLKRLGLGDLLSDEPQGPAAADPLGPFSMETVTEQLSTVFDPEIPINVVDLGLIYRCEATPLPGGGNRVEIDMSMTAPGCGMGDILAEDARNKVLTVPGVAEVQVEVVFDPPWGMERMSEAAKLQLGLY